MFNPSKTNQEKEKKTQVNKTGDERGVVRTEATNTVVT